MSASAVADMVQDVVRANADESLLNLAAKAHGNPFLVSELVGRLDEEGRLNVSGGRAVATGRGLPRRLGAGMQQRLDLLSEGASEVVRVAADEFANGVKDGKVVQPHEYQDAYGFIKAGQRLLEAAAQLLDIKLKLRALALLLLQVVLKLRAHALLLLQIVLELRALALILSEIIFDQRTLGDLPAAIMLGL